MGEKYTLNEQRTFDKLSAALRPSKSSSLKEGQPLFLFDKIGSSQISQWVEISDPVDTDAQTGVSEEQEETIDVPSDAPTNVSTNAPTNSPTNAHPPMLHLILQQMHNDVALTITKSVMTTNYMLFGEEN